jgi:hypothetical protein
MTHSDVMEWLLIAIFLFIILWILYRPCRRMEGFDSENVSRRKINSELPYLVANEPSLYLRNTDGKNIYELRLDANGLIVYNNDELFMTIYTNNKFPVAETQTALLYDNNKYIYSECISTKGKSSTELSGYDKRTYGDAYYFKSEVIGPLPNVSNADLYLTSEGNLVATNTPMIWANGFEVITNQRERIYTGQFITDGTGNYFEYIHRDEYVFEHYKLQESPWELILTNTINVPQSFLPTDILYSYHKFGVSNETIYTSDGDGVWKWANGYEVSDTLSDGELRVNGWMISGNNKLQLKKDGIYVNGNAHIKFTSEVASSMKLENGNLIVRDENGETIWNLNTGPNNATKLKISDSSDDNTLYLTDDKIRWTIYPDELYNFTKEETQESPESSEYEGKKKYLKEIQTVHSGSDERYANLVSTYYREMINTFNLGIGLIVGTIVIIR